MLFVGTAHIALCGTKLREAAALPAGALTEEFTVLADVQPSAVLLIGGTPFLWQGGDKLAYGGVDALAVVFLKEAFSAKGLCAVQAAYAVQESITEATEQGGRTAENVPPEAVTPKPLGTTFSGLSKSLRA